VEIEITKTQFILDLLDRIIKKKYDPAAASKVLGLLPIKLGQPTEFETICGIDSIHRINKIR